MLKIPPPSWVAHGKEADIGLRGSSCIHSCKTTKCASGSGVNKGRTCWAKALAKLSGYAAVKRDRCCPVSS